MTTPMRSGIPTTYRSTNFRSRLEARWAAFFDLIGWSWVYEPLDADGYIPDFLIQGPHPLFVEVGPCVTEQDYREKAAKAHAAAEQLRHDVLVLGVSPDFLWLGEFHGNTDCGGTECGYQVGDPCACPAVADLAWGQGAWSTCTEDESNRVKVAYPARKWQRTVHTEACTDPVFGFDCECPSVEVESPPGSYFATGPGCFRMGVAHQEMSFRLRPCGHYPGGHIHPPKPDINKLWAEAGNRVQWKRAA